MLLELYGQNFGCFRDEFHLSMLATRVDPDSDRGIIEVKVEGDDEPLRLLRAVAIYGANASGKSTVLHAAATLGRLISETAGLKSDDPLPGHEPFALRKPDADPVRLGVVAIIDNKVHDYQIEFNAAKFLSERLVRKEIGNETVLFDRSLQDVSGQWTHDEGFALISRSFRPNALLLSLADLLAPALAGDLAAGIRRLLRVVDPTSPLQFFAEDSLIAERVQEDPPFASWLLSHLKSADIGVVGLDTNRRKVTGGKGPGTGDPKTESRLSLALSHQGAARSFPIPYTFESKGTRRMVELGPLLYDLTHGDKPQAAFVDEIDASLHPVLLRGLVQRFNCQVPSQDAHSQLIFVTHDTTLLDAEAKDAVLRRDQIYLTEKDNSGAARLYSIAEFKERNNLNLRHRYLEGRYGALPSLGTFTE